MSSLLLVLREILNCLPSTFGINCTDHVRLSWWYILPKQVLICELFGMKIDLPSFPM